MKIVLMSLQSDLHALGLKYLHYYLLKKGYDSSILYLPDFDESNAGHLESVKEFVRSGNPGFIGVSLMSHEYEGAQSLTRHLKSFAGEIPVVWGGIHPTISPAECLKSADFVCVGEGEDTIVRIAEAIAKKEDIKKVNNLCYIDGGRMVRNPLYPLVENLDSISPYELIPRNSFILAHNRIERLDEKLFEKYDRYFGKMYSAATSRGCPFSCTFCCNNIFSQLYRPYKIRRRSVPSIISELKAGIRDNPKVGSVFFLDDCFLTCSNEYLENFCASYKAEIGKPFTLLSIPTYITKNRLELLKDAGLNWVGLGLQSGSDRVCKEIYKRRSLRADFLKAATVINDLKIAAYYDVILDNPFENDADKFETIETLIETPKPCYVCFYSLTFYHGTELYEKARVEYPQYVEDCRKKDFIRQNNTAMNRIIKISAFTDPRLVRYLVKSYKAGSRRAAFKALLFCVELLNLFIVEPMTYFETIRLSQQGSYIKTFKEFSFYFKRGITRYLNQFGRKKEAQ